jgi:hypothetical protein
LTVDELMVDGNAAAGELQQIFAVEVTELRGVCASCGATAPLAEADAWTRGPGVVLRCRGCHAVLVRLVHTRDRTLVELTMVRLEVPGSPADQPGRP